MQATRFFRFYGARFSSRIEARMPKRFAGVDIAETGDARLVKEEIFERPHGCGKQVAETRRRELARKGVHAQGSKPGAVVQRIECIHPAEMAPVRKSEHPISELKCHINMDAVLASIGAFEEFLCAGKPQKLPIEAEVERQHALV